jgi:hypothetical protein
MTAWTDGKSHSVRRPAPGYELTVTKWAHGWGWDIDTVPSAVLTMDQTGRLTGLPGGRFLAKGKAPTREAAKDAADTAWSRLNQDNEVFA